jgi:hypothetical protein
MAAKAATQATIHMTMGALEQGLKSQLLRAILLTHAWVAASAAMTIFAVKKSSPMDRPPARGS